MPKFPPLEEARIIEIAGDPKSAGDDEIASLAWEVLSIRNDPSCSKAGIVSFQVRAMRSIVENMRASLASYVDAVKQSPELRARLVNDPASELGGAFGLVIRRASAIVDSAANVGDGPTPEPKEPAS